MLRSLFSPVLKGLIVCTVLGSLGRSQEVQPLDPSIVLAEQIFPALQPILRDAALQAPRALSANIDYLVAEEGVGGIRSRMLPSVTTNGTYSIARDQRVDGDFDPSNTTRLTYSAGISQPVYHWGALKNSVTLAKISAKIGERNYAEAYRLLAQEIRLAYLRMVVARASLNRSKASLRLAENEMKVAQSKLERGAISAAELFSPQLRLEEATLDADRAEEAFRFSKVTVQRLAGTREFPDDEIPTLIPHLEYSAETIKTLLNRFIGTNGAEENLRVSIAKLQLEQERLNYKIIKTNLYPKFNVVSGITQDENIAAQARTQSLYAGLNLNWTIFDGFNTRSAKRQSLLRRRQLEALVDDRTKEQVDLVRNQAKLVDFAARQTAFGEARLAQFDGLIAYKIEDVKRGYTSQTDLETVTLARDDVLIATMGYRIEYLAQLTAFLSTIGRDPALEQILPSRK